MCYTCRRVCSSSLLPLIDIYFYIYSRFFEWKKNVPKTPYFIYQNQTFTQEKHYPNVNTDKILDGIDKNKFPLLAMAGIFDINRNCDVRISIYINLYYYYYYYYYYLD